MRSTPFVVAVSLVVASATAAAAATPVQVIEHHVAMMKKGDLKGIMSDYAPSAVVITPNGLVRGQSPQNGVGVFSGAARARQVFATLTDKDHHPGVVAMQARIEPNGDDVALLHWVQFKGTPRQVSGEDVFVVRGGKIVYQAILVDPAK